ncbi:MAG: 3'(2'),5'-bisphosphate nucleotidase CysQ [Pseudomonadota bacterium]
MQESDLQLLTDAAEAAGEIALRYFQCDNKVWDKGHDDPVSEADFAVDRYLRETLMAARPDYGWLSEETEDTEERLSRDTVFIVDPIDGTRAFVAGESTWAHSLGIAHKGQAVAAVVFLPARQKLYVAGAGGGAFLNGAPMHASQQDDLVGADLLASRPALDAHHWPGGVPAMTRHFRPSLAYRLSLVGEGRFDAMLTLRDSWEWDIAAGALIAAEAGATVTDKNGGALRFNTPGRVTAGILACAPALHPQITHRMQAAA